MSKSLLPLLVFMMLLSGCKGQIIQPSDVDSITTTALPTQPKVKLIGNTYDRSTNIINANYNIDDKDEAVIKGFRSHQDYTNNELKNLGIKYLGTVDGYRIYHVPFKGSSGVLNPTSWTKEGYTFPIECQTKIIGIKSTKLYTIGNLINETSINIKQLYEVLPEEFKINKFDSQLSLNVSR